MSPTAKSREYRMIFLHFVMKNNLFFGLRYSLFRCDHHEDEQGGEHKHGVQADDEIAALREKLGNIGGDIKAEMKQDAGVDRSVAQENKAEKKSAGKGVASLDQVAVRHGKYRGGQNQCKDGGHKTGKLL